MSVGSLGERRRLLVCVGTGGVGKTTLASALALGAALRGRRAMVLTIDPARALSRALGIGELGAEATPVAREHFRAAGLEVEGTLSAAMLDQKSAWDGFIRRHAPSEAIYRSILENPFYDELSRRFAGATEYVAVEELCRLHESGHYDLIVLDTPPAAHALDFVTASTRIDRFLDSEVAAPLLEPALRRGNAIGKTVRLLLSRLKRATGKAALGDVSALFAALGGFQSEIRRRADRARALLFGPDCAFVWIVGPREIRTGESASLGARMQELRLPLGAVIQNRVHPLDAALDPAAEAEASRIFGELGAALGGSDALAWAEAAFGDALAIARAEARDWHALEQTLSPALERARVAELGEDLHALGDLARVADVLWAS